MSNLQLIHEAVVVAAGGGGDGLLDWGTTKINEVGDLFRVVAVVAGIGFVIVQAIQSRGAMARIIISGLAAAVFVWIVFNVTALKDRVDNEVNSQPAPHQRASVGGAPPQGSTSSAQLTG